MGQMIQATGKAVEKQQDSLKDLKLPPREEFPNLSGKEASAGAGK